MVPTLPVSGVKLTPLQLPPTQPASTLAGDKNAAVSKIIRMKIYVPLISPFSFC